MPSDDPTHATRIARSSRCDSLLNNHANTMILVTGGAGFIGANFVLDWIAATGEPVVNLDALTYAGNLESLKSLDGDTRHIFVKGDISDRPLLDRVFAEHQPRAVVHFAAESHVDRSIHGPGTFVQTNVNGTFAPVSYTHLTLPTIYSV